MAEFTITKGIDDIRVLGFSAGKVPDVLGDMLKYGVGGWTARNETADEIISYLKEKLEKEKSVSGSSFDDWNMSFAYQNRLEEMIEELSEKYLVDEPPNV